MRHAQLVGPRIVLKQRKTFLNHMICSSQVNTLLFKVFGRKGHLIKDLVSLTPNFFCCVCFNLCFLFLSFFFFFWTSPCSSPSYNCFSIFFLITEWSIFNFDYWLALHYIVIFPYVCISMSVLNTCHN